jgi:hypothetical protein
MRTVEEIILTRDKYKSILERSNEALLAYAEELRRIKRFMVETGGNSESADPEE